MRTITIDDLIIENVRFTKNALLEIGIKNYLPFLIRRKSFNNGFQAQFSINAKDIEVEKEGGNWVKLSDLGTDALKYTVNIKGPNKGLLRINREGYDENIKVNMHSVTFANDLGSSGNMSNLKGNIGIVVLSTVAKVLTVFVEEYKSQFQCFTFSPANDRLIGVYEILAKESERQTSTLIYANKDSGKNMKRWFLLNKVLWNKFLSIKKGKE